MSNGCSARLSASGQITIPEDLRRALGLEADTVVDIAVEDGAIVIRKISDGPTRGRQLADRLRGRGDVEMTTDEILALSRGSSPRAFDHPTTGR